MVREPPVHRPSLPRTGLAAIKPMEPSSPPPSSIGTVSPSHVAVNACAVFCLSHRWPSRRVLFATACHRAHVSVGQAAILVLTQQSTCGWTIRLILLVAPLTFYWQIFLPCWECFDFEAAATHEIGHAIGLSHPDRAASSLCTGSGCSEVPGQNSYNSFLTAAAAVAAAVATGTAVGGAGATAGAAGLGGASLGWNASSCLEPWRWVAPGLPPEVVGDKDGVRPSIMKALTQHNPKVPLEANGRDAPHSRSPPDLSTPRLLPRRHPCQSDPTFPVAIPSEGVPGS